VRLKSTLREIVVGFIISLSAVMFGYSLKEITSVPIATILQEYSITVSKFAAQSILIGILPFGAILGVVITKLLITRYRRLTGIYIFTFVNIGAMVLVNITNFGTLIAGRFVEGICVGYYTTIAPIYLK
jgi:predicted MFS family arabinose efflux permease